MGRFASSLTWGVCDSNMPGNGILPAGVGDLAGVFLQCFLDPGLHDGGDGRWCCCRSCFLGFRLWLQLWRSSTHPPPWQNIGHSCFQRPRCVLYKIPRRVAPLLFFNVLPLYRPIMQTTLLEVWLVVTVLYFAAGLLMFVANYRRLDDLQERRRARALCFALLIFGMIVVHNLFTRNWTNWFGSAPPRRFSEATSISEALLFPLVPLTL